MENSSIDDLPIYSLNEDEQNQEKDLDSRIIRLEDEEQKQKDDEPGFLGTVADVAKQAGRGYLKLYTWPADVLKLGMIGEGLSDIDEIEEAFKKEGKPFDRDAYVRTVLDTSSYIPSQDLLEEGVENVTGMSFEPKTEVGRRAKQAVELFGFTRGGLAKKATSAAVGAGTTVALKQAGVGEGKAGVIGDLASVGPQLIEKAVSQIPKSAKNLEAIAQKNALPFKEFMVREREPVLKGRLTKTMESNLKKSFDVNTKEALNKIINNELPIRKLREKGINLDALGEHAYEQTEKLAIAKPNVIKTDQMVKNIESEVKRIKSLSPSPSESQRAAIDLLEREANILKVSKPTSQQIVNQHKNYNSDAKSIYRKPEFTGKEEQVRKAYAFLNNELMETLSKQGNADVANALKAANKIYHEKSKLLQTESILAKAFPGDKYNPKKLDKILTSKQGNFLRRNMSPSAIKEIEDIAHYGKIAEEKLDKFINLRSPQVLNEVRSWGQLAPMIFLPHTLKGALMGIAQPTAGRVQGYLLSRDATREIYKLTMKHAAEGAFNLLKKDFVDLEREISKEWGSVDDFMDDVMAELEIYEEK